MEKRYSGSSVEAEVKRSRSFSFLLLSSIRIVASRCGSQHGLVRVIFPQQMTNPVVISPTELPVNIRSLAKIPITIPNIKPLSVAEIEIIAIRQSLNVMKEILAAQGQKE